MNKSQKIQLDHLSNATQQRILESAIKIFSQKGFSGSTTKEIAHEAGVSEATIFRYFETKKDLLLSLLSPAMVKSITELFFDIHGKSLNEVLKNFLSGSTHAIDQNENLLKIILYEACFHPDIKNIVFNDIVQKKTKLLQTYFSNQLAEGDFNEDVDPATATQALIGMLVGFMIFKYAFRTEPVEDVNDDKVIDDIVRIFLYGIKKR